MASNTENVSIWWRHHAHHRHCHSNTVTLSAPYMASKIRRMASCEPMTGNTNANKQGIERYHCEHYNDVIMGAMASQLTNLTIVYSTVYSVFSRRSKLRVTGLCKGNSPVTGEFPAQMASNAENVSIWWRHHGRWSPDRMAYSIWHLLRHIESRWRKLRIFCGTRELLEF